MKNTLTKTLSGLLMMIAMIVGITAAAEGAVNWLDSIAVAEPTKIAVDSAGSMYVTEAFMNRLSIYDNNGNFKKSIRGFIKGPIGVALDSAGKIYIGNEETCNVVIYKSDYTYDKMIGGIACGTPKEFDRPNSIAVASNGDIYVVNTKSDQVKVYNAEGSPKFIFGGSGMGDGKFNFPLDMVIDETVGELYVVDLGIFMAEDDDGNPTIPTAGARVQAFDLDGVFIRSFGQYGIGQNLPDGIMTRPAGIAVDKLGRLNVTDSLQGKVHIFSRTGVSVGSIKDAEHPLNTPMGIAIGQDEQMHIVSASGAQPSVEIYGLEDYTSLEVTPKAISLSGYAGGTAAGEDVTIGNNGPGDMNWTAQKASGSEWITLSKASGTLGGTTSEAVTVGADLSSLSAGAYTGKFKVITGGAEEEVTVSLQVNTGGTLEVTPLDLIYTGQAGGVQPAAKTVTITLAGGDISWAATSNAPSWLTIDPAAGSVGAVQASVAVDTTGLTAATYQSSITITADGVTGSPATINVTLILADEGKIQVSTNIAEANWNITGAAAYQGSGLQWSQQNAPAGQYQISFEAVSGYAKPQDRIFTVQSGNTAEIDVQYKDLRATKKIIAGSGSGSKDPASDIKVLNTDGSPAGAAFTAFSVEHYGVKVAAGDTDGDGIDEIMAGAGANKENPARVKLFKADGSELIGADFIAFTTLYGVNIAAGDIDGDGKDEIIVGTGTGKNNSSNIRVFKYMDGEITDTGINSILDASEYGAYVAAGDIDGDGKDEIITGTGPDKNVMATVRILKADTSGGMGSWTVAEVNAIIVGEPKTGAVVAAGDLNGDGKAEILAGRSDELNIKTYNADGSAYGVEITETDKDLAKMYKEGAGIAAGDTDDDGIAEIVIGTGPHKKSPAQIRIYSAAGALMNSFTAFSEPGGVNVCVGEVE